MSRTQEERRIHKPPAPFAVALVLLLCQCGGLLEPNDNASGTAADVPVEQFVTEMTHAVCGNLATCCASLGKEPSTTCAADVSATWQPLITQGPIQGATYDPKRAKLCIEAHRRAWSRCQDRKRETYALDEACLGVFVDPRASAELGERCGFSMDCKDARLTQTYCFVSSVPSRHCQRRATARLGEPCGNVAPNHLVLCENTAICQGNASSADSPGATCQPLGNRDEYCGQPALDNCGVDLVCDRDGTQRCRAALPFGASCTNDSDCEHFRCDSTLHCRPSPDLLSGLFCKNP